MNPDYDRAATLAAETLIKYKVSCAPVIPLPILKSMPGVLVLSFTEMAGIRGVDRDNLLTMFRVENHDAMTVVKEIDGKTRYFVAYNQRLPFYLLQRSLARELGHIVLGHDGSRPEDVRTIEAQVFAYHFLCPRPLINAVQESIVPLTIEVFGTMTGCYERCLAGISKTPATHVPASLNRAIKAQFQDYIDTYLEYQTFMPFDDESRTADFGTYMDGYEE